MSFLNWLFICLLAQTVYSDDICSWFEFKNSWPQGYKGSVKINMNETVQSWNVDFDFSQDVSFEAWKGEVTQMSSRQYSVTNKCYNGLLYSCQCLEIGYLVRYNYGMKPPEVNITFNGVKAPECSQEPNCDGSEELTTTTTLPSPTTTTLAIDPDFHPCDNDPCHPDALCEIILDTNDFTCSCPNGTSPTGVNLTDPTSNKTGCEIDGDLDLSSNGTQDESQAVEDFLSSVFTNISAFQDLVTILDTLDEDATIEELIVAIFNSSSGVELLLAAAAGSPDVNLAIIDAIGNNTDASSIFIQGLLGDSTYDPDEYEDYTLPADLTLPSDLDLADLLSGRRQKRQSQTLNRRMTRAYARKFMKLAAQLKKIIRRNGLCNKFKELMLLLASANSTCDEIENLAEEIWQILRTNNVLTKLAQALYLRQLVTSNFGNLIGWKKFFIFLIRLVQWQNLWDCMGNGLNYLELTDEKLCSPSFCCSDGALCSTNEGKVECISTTTRPTTKLSTVTQSTTAMSTTARPTTTKPTTTLSTVTQSTTTMSTTPRTSKTTAKTAITSTYETTTTSKITTSSTGETPVVMTKTTPSTGETPVVMTKTTPSSGETPVIMTKTTPSTGETPVVMTKTTPSTGETPVVMTTMTPSTGETPYLNTKTTLSTGETPVAITKTTPSTGETPVIITKTTPSTGETPVVIIKTTPSTGETPVIITKTTPSTGETPSIITKKTPPPGETPIAIIGTTPPTGETPVEIPNTTPPTGEIPVEIPYTMPPTGETPIEITGITPPTGETPVEIPNTTPPTREIPVEITKTTPPTGVIPVKLTREPSGLYVTARQ